MRDDRTAAVVRGFDDALNLAEREAWFGFAVRPPAIVGVNLDQVDTVRDLIARDAHDAIETVGFIGALRNRVLRRETLRRVFAGDDHRRSGYEHARPGD